ncbi:MAG: hypothetical protein WCE23_11400 [Candidatus Binatus sp.]|uniref:hypothetical protein n=1 Tax=Candidatus Binatus sp. TaxID=2811406 RepID=UPI003C76E5BE
MAAVVIQVVSFDWDEENEGECRAHGLTPFIVVEVNERFPLYFLNKIGRTATHMMIGPSMSGRFWVVAILPHEKIVSCWRPITGYPAEKKEMELYEQEMARLARQY